MLDTWREREAIADRLMADLDHRGNVRPTVAHLAAALLELIAAAITTDRILVLPMLRHRGASSPHTLAASAVAYSLP